MNKSGESLDISGEKLQNWIVYYAKRNSIEIKIDSFLHAPAAIDASDINKPIIYFNPKLTKEQYKLNDEKMYFVLFHEIEHLKEQVELLSNENGKKLDKQKDEKLAKYGKLAESIYKLENVFRDIYVNNEVVSSANMPVLKDSRTDLYKNHLFKEKDYLNAPVYDEEGNVVETRPLPKHLQFLYTILRESMIIDEKCIIDPKIRNIIDRLELNGAISSSTQGRFEYRLQNLWYNIEPIYKKLLDEDIKDQEQKSDSKEGESNESNDSGKNNNQEQNKQKKSKQNGEEQGKKQESNSENGQANQEENQSKGQESSKSILDQIKGKIGDLIGNNDSKEQKNQDEQEEQNLDKNKENSKEEQNEEREKEAKNPFEDFYDKMPDLPHILEDSIGEEKMKEAREKLAEAKKTRENEKQKSKEELELEQRVRNMGIEENEKTNFENTKKQLQKYDDFLKQLEKLKDSHTGESIMDEIENMFQQIRSRREKPKYKSRGPVDIERGVRLDPSAIASGMANIKAGNLDPEMFLEDIKYEKEKDFVGRFDLTIIADGSSSMSGEKNRQQKIATLAIFEALKRLQDRLEEQKAYMKSGVDFNTDGYLFYGAGIREIKSFGSDFTDVDRLNSYQTLDYDSGGTNDYDAIKKLIDNYNLEDYEYKNDIRNGKIKKIVIVMTDGESANKSKLKSNIEKLRNAGILVYGLGITSGGESVIESYAGMDNNLGFGKVCEKSEDLALVLRDLLMEHLKKI